jgi:hypothetical protein
MDVSGVGGGWCVKSRSLSSAMYYDTAYSKGRCTDLCIQGFTFGLRQYIELAYMSSTGSVNAKQYQKFTSGMIVGEHRM